MGLCTDGQAPAIRFCLLFLWKHSAFNKGLPSTLNEERKALRAWLSFKMYLIKKKNFLRYPGNLHLVPFLS